MAGTNWSKVERLKLELRVGVATRLMDRVAYGEIREWLTVRLMVSEQTYKVYDHAAMMADRFEERLLMELESACWERETLAEEVARGTAERVAGMSAGGADTNKEKPVWAETKGMERHLLEAASKLPELDPEDVQREAFWMARRNRLERDPRLLKPAVFARLVGQMLRMLKEARTADGTVPGRPGGGGGVRGKREGTERTQRGGGMAFAAARPAAPVMSGAGAVVAATQSVGLCADSAGLGVAQSGGGVKSGVSTEGTERTQRGGAAAAQPTGLRADSAGFDSAQRGSARSGVATKGTERTQRGDGVAVASVRPAATVMSGTGAASGVEAQPAGFRTGSAGFGATARKAEATGRVPARKAGRKMPLSASTQVRPVEPATYAAAFHAAARADGKGALLDVAPAVIDQARREGLSPQEAVFRVRMDRIRACAGGFNLASSALDRLESARKGAMG